MPMILVDVDELPNGDYIEYLNDGLNNLKVRYRLIQDNSTPTGVDRLYLIEHNPT